MLVNMKDILADARKNKYAIGCINTPTVDIARAVVGAAEELGTPIIIDHAQVHDPLVPIEYIGPYMVEFAKKAKVPVCVHLDHGSDYNFLMRAIRCGFSSIMYDCSALSLEENIANVAPFVKIAHNLGLTVEGEIGAMPSGAEDSHGGEDAVVTNADIRKFFTKPEEAQIFAEQTGVDALAVVFGTMHGIYAEPPVLDIERLDAIRAVVPDETQIVIHGASGVDVKQLGAAIDHGCVKVNYYSYMAKHGAEETKNYLNNATGTVFYHELTELMVTKLRDYAKDVMRVFMNGKQPTF